MVEPAPISDQIEELRRRAGELAEKAEHAQTIEGRETLKDLAKMYEEMAKSVAQLEEFRAMVREHKP